MNCLFSTHSRERERERERETERQRDRERERERERDRDTVIAQIFVRDLISYISYFWRKVRNLVAYENHTRMHVYLTPSSLYENF